MPSLRNTQLIPGTFLRSWLNLAWQPNTNSFKAFLKKDYVQTY